MATTLKRLGVLLFAVVAFVSMALALPAYAASITITQDESIENGSTTGETYTAYKIFDASYEANLDENAQSNTATIIDDGNDEIAYSIAADSPWVSVLWNTTTNAAQSGQTWFTLTLSADGTKYLVTATDGMTTANHAIAAADWLLAHKPSGAPSTSLTPGTAAEVDPGYYLIESSLGSNLVLATTDISIVEKNTYPGSNKELTNPTTDGSVQIGDTVPYTVTVTIPTGADKDIILTDVATKGLTLNTAITVTGAVESPAFTSATWTLDSTDDATGAKTYKLTIPKATVVANAGKTLTLTYSAIVNEFAVVQGTDANTNTLKLDYGNFTSTSTTPGVDTQQITVTKYDGTDSSKTPIAGAEFELRNASGAAIPLVKVSDTEYRVANTNAGTTDTTTVTKFATVAGTPITISGVDKDVTYSLVEVTTPTGYNPLTEATSVQPSDTIVVNAEIANNKGTELPSTGGIGTTILYIIGGVLVVGAGIVLVANRRANANR